ncbi:MAG: MauE/DoxX family redox-associated membrane protein [Acidimicrobiales bacterium]
MPLLTGPALAAAALLVLAGAQKLLDPAMTVGALQALRLPSSSVLVRAGSATEVALGIAAVVVGGPVLWSLVAASYLAFAAFVIAALRRGTMIGSCGCFGREDTPPHPVHVTLDIALAGLTLAAAGTIDTPIVDALADHPGTGVVIVGLAALGTYLLYAAFVELPRTLAAARAARG